MIMMKINRNKENDDNKQDNHDDEFDNDDIELRNTGSSSKTNKE